MSDDEKGKSLESLQKHFLFPNNDDVLTWRSLLERSGNKVALS